MKPNYYANIIAPVRYDKDLTPNAKLLYGEITALANKHGYCYASSQYFADLYGVKRQTVSSWISQLKKKGYIKVIIKSNYKRKIYIEGVCQNPDRGMSKNSFYN
jgi:DNA-binding MarR family transcriptional regulator